MKETDKLTLQKMIKLYKGNDVDKESLAAYSMDRLKKCPFNADEKPRCVKCKIHCYDKPHQEQIIKVMRQTKIKFSLLHPLLTVRYFMRL
ncbi:MAG: nitrous oxide-stimulated promoter family protein [Clostridiales bacterium]|nr:nitrous oxide-stimulated promoter family protein [Clostridiales bacterium]